ncbi:MAG: S-layer protein, partial [Synergistaceae bacterium]|nr:S-layer protein [Synergistaceae bacterium]
LSLHDWMDDDGLYTDNDAAFTDRTYRGFYFNKPFAMGNFAFYVSRPDEANTNRQGVAEHYEIGARAKFNFNEQLWLSLNGMMRKYDANVLTSALGVPKEDEHIYWAALGINFTPAIALKAAYYGQEVQVGDNVATDSPNALQAIIDIKQDALKFTSVWAEYWSFDNNFTAWTDGPWDNYGADVTGADTVNQGGPNIGLNYDSVIFFKLNQKWTDQWSTFQRYFIGNARNEIPGVTDNTTNWTFGVKYNYTPGLSFELAYDKIENAGTVVNDDDSLIRFRTHIAF